MTNDELKKVETVGLFVFNRVKIFSKEVKDYFIGKLHVCLVTIKRTLYGEEFKNRCKKR